MIFGEITKRREGEMSYIQGSTHRIGVGSLSYKVIQEKDCAQGAVFLSYDAYDSSRVSPEMSESMTSE